MQINKIIFILFISFSLILLVSACSRVYADDFYPTGDVEKCSFASTTAIEIETIKNDVKYNINDVSGARAGWIRSNTFKDLASITYPDARRFPGIADYVAVPPGTTVNIGLMVWNYTGHDVHTNRIDFFTSYEDPAQGDLTKLGAEGSYQTISFDDGQGSRSGKVISLPGVGNFGSRQEDKGRIFYSFDTIQPVKKEEYRVLPRLEGNDLVLRHELTLRNQSNYNLDNIEIAQLGFGQYKEQVSIGKQSSKSIVWEENLGRDYPNPLQIPNLKISDPNSHIESNADYYNSQSQFRDWSARSTYVYRNDSSNKNWYGIQPSWGQTERDLVTIELIPYWFEISHQDINLEPELTIDHLVSKDKHTFLKEITVIPTDPIYSQIIIRNKGFRANDIEIGDLFASNYIKTEYPNWGGGELINENTLIWRRFEGLKTGEEWVLEPKFEQLQDLERIGNEPYSFENEALLILGEPIANSIATINVNPAVAQIPIEPIEQTDSAEQDSTSSILPRNVKTTTNTNTLAKTGENYLLSISLSLLAPVAFLLARLKRVLHF